MIGLTRYGQRCSSSPPSTTRRFTPKRPSLPGESAVPVSGRVFDNQDMFSIVIRDSISGLQRAVSPTCLNSGLQNL